MATAQRQVDIRPEDNLVQPFLLESSGVRGRLLRLGEVIDRIVVRSHYPAPVAQLLAELVAIGAVLASTLKFDGVFTLQTSSDGPVRTLVADMTSQGAVRGYAGYDAEAVNMMQGARPTGDVSTWLGKGHLAFTVDQGVHSQRYQGLVELVGPRLADCLLHYFKQSQQLNAGLLLAADQLDGRWRAGALLIEQIPDGEGTARAEEDWQRSMVLAASCTEGELLDPTLSAERLLYRLFHEEGVRVFAPQPLAVGCRCTREKVAGILKSFPRGEVEGMKRDGEVVVTCEFCNVEFRFDDGQLDRLYRAP